MSALSLRLLACGAMLLDHVAYTFVVCLPWLSPLRWIGRIAFPIFVYLLVNGCRHTSSPLRYAGRLGLFALISQIPFALFCYGDAFYPKLNVFFALLAGCIAIFFAQALEKRGWKPLPALLPGMLLAILLHFSPVPMDYGAKGVLMAVVFWLFDGNLPIMALGLTLSIFYPQLLMLASSGVWSFSAWDIQQLFALAALIPICRYNGEAGWKPQKRMAQKAMQLTFYAFYPVHIMLLWMVSK